MALLDHEWRTSAQIAEALGKTPGAIYATLTQLALSGDIERREMRMSGRRPWAEWRAVQDES
jgi:predicted transcriptional regulator